MSTLSLADISIASKHQARYDLQILFLLDASTWTPRRPLAQPRSLRLGGHITLPLHALAQPSLDARLFVSCALAEPEAFKSPDKIYCIKIFS